jgi:anti-sigma regulatory factor (Ser/Thr protein kinase)
VSTTDWSLVTADANDATRARLAIRRFLALQADVSSDLDAAELIVGELVANVIRYAPGPIGIHVTWEGAEAILVVADRGPGVPPVRAVPELTASSGRGLMLIQALARTVEIKVVPGRGTRVVVHLPVYRGPRGDEGPSTSSG